jgi:hypothetical protein
MINWDAIWIKLQELWAGVDQALLATVVLPLLAILIPIVIYRRTTRHERRLEEARRDQDRREGVYRDLLTLLDPVTEWLLEIRESGTKRNSPLPPKLDDSLLVKVNIGMDLLNQFDSSILNTSSWWWPEWKDAYKHVVCLAEETEQLSPIPLMRLENAEVRLRRSFDSRNGILAAWLEFKKMYWHGVRFLGEPTFSEQLLDRFERLVERIRAFRRGFAERAEIRRQVRQERELSQLTTEHFFYTPDENSARSLAEDKFVIPAL